MVERVRALGRSRHVVGGAATAAPPCRDKEVAISVDIEALGEDYCVTHDHVIVRIHVENLFCFVLFGRCRGRENGQVASECELKRITLKFETVKGVGKYASLKCCGIKGTDKGTEAMFALALALT